MRLTRQIHNSQKHTAPSIKLILTISLLAFVAAAVIADIFWTSSSTTTSAFRYVSANFPPVKSKGPKKYDAQGRVLSATFADLPAPKLLWEQMPTAPVPRLDGAAIQIKNIFYVFAGYGTIDYIGEQGIKLRSRRRFMTACEGPEDHFN